MPTTELELLGLSLHEARVYGVLVRMNRAQVRELAAAARLPTPHVYPALRRLAARGMIVEHSDHTKSYSALPPADVFRNLEAEEKARLKRKLEAVQHISKLYERRRNSVRGRSAMEIQTDPPSGHHPAMVERRRRMRRAQTEVLFLSSLTPPRADKKTMVPHDRDEVKALKRGVRFRCVFQASFLEDPWERERNIELYRLGERSRVVARLPINMVAIDSNVAWFQLPSQAVEHVGVKVNDPDLIEALKACFEYYWSQGKDLMDYIKAKWPDNSPEGKGK